MPRESACARLLLWSAWAEARGGRFEEEGCREGRVLAEGEISGNMGVLLPLFDLAQHRSQEELTWEAENLAPMGDGSSSDG